MSNNVKAKEVLIRSREEVLRELARAGENGGTGLAQRYAPILVNLQGAIEALDRMDSEVKENFADKMKAAKAAKKVAEQAAQ